MAKPLQMTQDEFRRAFPQLADSRAPEPEKQAEKRGDGSRYGKRHVSGVMNKTESEYAAMLEMRKISGDIKEYWFEHVRLKLAENLTFTADFMIREKDDSVTFVDVKGGGPIERKSIDKCKVAAKTYPMWTFQMAKKQSKADGGGFVVREF